jgi:hypothetical protein
MSTTKGRRKIEDWGEEINSHLPSSPSKLMEEEGQPKAVGLCPVLPATAARDRADASCLVLPVLTAALVAVGIWICGGGVGGQEVESQADLFLLEERVRLFISMPLFEFKTLGHQF